MPSVQVFPERGFGLFCFFCHCWPSRSTIPHRVPERMWRVPACLPVVQIWLLIVFGENIRAGGSRISLHGSKRKRLRRLTVNSVQICIFVIADVSEHKVALPAGGRRIVRSQKFQRQR